MKVIGKQIKDMVEVMNCLSMAIFTKENTHQVELMARGYSLGLMVKYMMGSGLIVLKKDMEYGLALMEIHTLANGRIAKLMAMEFTFGKMEIVMKVSGKPV
jgi:hypothetical protein